jgi:hypothetical protein
MNKVFVSLVAAIFVVASVLAGTCNENDVLAIKREWPAFDNDIATCGKKSWFNSTEASACLVEQVGLNQHCADTFGQFIHCQGENCASSCLLDPLGADCCNCYEKSCLPALEAASTLQAGTDFPISC